LRKGESPVLPGEEREEKAEGAVGAGGVCQQREHAFFFFQVPLKPTLPQQEGRPRRFPPNNEGVRKGMGGSQPWGWSGPSSAIYMNPKLFLLLACLKLPLRDNIPEILFGGLLKGYDPSSVSVLS
jgi:hypothetical protein